MSATSPTSEPAEPRPSSSPYPRTVVALGLTSLFTDVSTEMMIPVMPLFVTTTLGASATSLGVIEGAAESAASLLRLGSGWLSDRLGKRKPFLVLGYGLSTISKGLIGFAAGWPAVLGLRIADRVGKGLRNPPRDALIADAVIPEHRGRAFGLHATLDTTGAILGPLVAFGMLALWPGNYRRVFAATVIPGVLSLLVLIYFVRATRRRPAPPQPLARTARELGAPFHRFVFADTLFQLGNSSMAFVLLRAKTGGMLDAFLPLAYVFYNVVQAALALPLGALSDRIGKRRLILTGYALYAGIYALLAWSGTPTVTVAALGLLGAHSALLSGSQRSLIADLVGPDARATAYGVYHTAVGLALFPASLLAGWLWDTRGARVTFAADVALALIAAIAFAILVPLHREKRDRFRGAAV